MSIVLDATTKSLYAVCEAITTNNPTVVVSYADRTSTSYTPGSQITSLNGATPVSICNAPSAGVQRIIKGVFIFNGDTTVKYIQVYVYISSTSYYLCKQYILPNQSLNLNESGWSVTGDMLSSQPGIIAYIGATSAPAGWLKCNGAAVSRTTYVNLYQVISTTFGTGDGSTTFNVPELRGEFIRCLDDSRNTYDTGRSLGGTAQSQADAFKSHGHDIGKSGYATSSEIGWGYGIVTAGPAYSGVVLATGGTETRPRNQALLAIIKY